MLFAREDVLAPPTEVELALDMALPGRLTLPAVVPREAADVGSLFVCKPVLLAVLAARLVAAEAGLTEVVRDDAWLGAAEPILRADVAVRAVETVVLDDMDVVDEPEEVEETLPAWLVAPALFGTALARAAALVAGALGLTRCAVERSCLPFWAVVGFDPLAVRTAVVRVVRVAVTLGTLTGLTSF